MNWGLFFFLLGWRQKMTKRLLAEGAGEGRDESGIVLTLPFLTFIMLKGHSEHPASSSPVVLWQAQTLHNLVAPRYHHSSHYLAKPIPFDLCSWCALFTIGRAPTCASALVKETRAEESAGEWMTKRRSKKKGRGRNEKKKGGEQGGRTGCVGYGGCQGRAKDQRQGDNKFKETTWWRV